jgi:hypothetical protein
MATVFDIRGLPDDVKDAMPPAHPISADGMVGEDAVQQFERDAVICLRGLLDVATVTA